MSGARGPSAFKGDKHVNLWFSTHRLALFAAVAALCLSSRAEAAFVATPEEAPRVESGAIPASVDEAQQSRRRSRYAEPPPPREKVEGTLLATAVKRAEAERGATPKDAAGRRVEAAESAAAHPASVWKILAIVSAAAASIASLWLFRSSRRS